MTESLSAPQSRLQAGETQKQEFKYLFDKACAETREALARANS